LGRLAGTGVVTANNVICIGALVDGANVSNSCYIGNIHGQTVDPGTGLSVFVDSAGKLGTTLSSRRFKRDIKPMDKSSEVVLALKPVTFYYRSDAQGAPQFGLVAEDVADLNPDLVVRDKDGELLSVRYDQVNAMLLNEFLKEHRKVQDLEKGMATLTARLEEQAAQIQKVNAQLETSRPAGRVVADNP
jgi:Chaperone of endosialidase